MNEIIYFIVLLLVIAFVYFDLIHSCKEIKSKKIRMNSLKVLRAKDLLVQELKDGIWATRGYDIYHSSDNGKNFVKKYRVPVNINSFFYLGKSKLIRKIFNRYHWMEIKVLPGGTILVFTDRKILRLNPNDTKKFLPVQKVKVDSKGIKFGVFSEGIALDKNGNCYYGEYYNNKKRKKINVKSSTDNGRTWKNFYTFADNEIRHVHALKYDKFTNSIWITTGDEKNEVKIGFFPNSRPKFNEIVSGIQDYCAVSLSFTKNHVFWGSDTPFMNSHIYRYDRMNGSITKVMKINGSSWHSTILKNGLVVISTTVEKVGKKAITDFYASIWVSDGRKKWEKLLKFSDNKKSKKNTIIRFPRGENSEGLIFTVINSARYRFDSFILSVKNLGDSENVK